MLIAIRKVFDGLPEARQASGLRRASSEREDALRWLRQRIREGAPLRFTDLPRALRRAVRLHFESYEDARREAAGSERFASVADAIAELRRLRGEGLRIAAPELTAAGHHELVRAISRFFGDLQTARRQAGIVDSEPRGALPIDAALDALRRRAAELSRTPRGGELQPTIRARLLERYGSYANAVARAGLTPLEPSGDEVGRTRLLETLRTLHAQEVPLTEQGLLLAGHSDVVAGARERFGTLRAALEASGLRSGNRTGTRGELATSKVAVEHTSKLTGRRRPEAADAAILDGSNEPVWTEEP